MKWNEGGVKLTDKIRRVAKLDPRVLEDDFIAAHWIWRWYYYAKFEEVDGNPCGRISMENLPKVPAIVDIQRARKAVVKKDAPAKPRMPRVNPYWNN